MAPDENIATRCSKCLGRAESILTAFDVLQALESRQSRTDLPAVVQYSQVRQSISGACSFADD